LNCYYEKFADGTVKNIDEEIPFEIPESWEWVRLEELGIFKGGKTPAMHNPKFWHGDVNWVTSKDMKSLYISESLLKITEDALQNMELFPIGTLLFVARSGILKRTFGKRYEFRENLF
jgi:Type I restriction modification DNA specificity domain.